MITPKITNLGYSNLWAGMSTILGYTSNFNQQIQKLFANGEQGFAYDPNDLTTLYQDVAGTIPVTASGQPVGLMKDKSGRNNHAYQTMAAKRPLLQRSAKTGAYYLNFDGIDDSLQTSNIDFTISDQMSLFVGICKIKESRPAAIVVLSAAMYQQNGTFGLLSPFSNGGTNSFSARGSVANTVKFYDTVPVTPYFTVLAAKMCISTDLMQLRNSGIVDKSSADLGVGNIGNHPLFIGNMGNVSYFFGGQVYSLIGVSRLATDNETLVLEKVIAKQVGVTLNV